MKRFRGGLAASAAYVLGRESDCSYEPIELEMYLPIPVSNRSLNKAAEVLISNNVSRAERGEAPGTTNLW
jgi:hypothetical protein